MLRIAICDDEEQARDFLRIQLEKVLDEETEEIVYEFSTGIRAVRWLRNHPGEIDLLFLDVEMPDFNGMTAAKQLREFNRELLIVFVTGYQDYVFDGYHVGALDYLVKPVKEEQLWQLIKRVHKIQYEKSRQSFVLKNTEGFYRFAYQDILYFYSEKRRVMLVTELREYPFYEKLDAVEACVGSAFVRIHQRYLVNASLVEHIGNNTVEIGGGILPISRALREEATKKLAKAMLREG